MTGRMNNRLSVLRIFKSVTMMRRTPKPIATIKRPAVLVAIGLVFLYLALVLSHSLSPLLCTPTVSTLLSSVEEGPLYASALATLRCLTTPNCFPSSQCRTGEPKMIRRRKHWEAHSLCVADVIEKKDCLVYSFGIHESWEWEEKAAKWLHCEVHAFDPTMNHPTNLAPGVTFHKLGLQAEGTDMSQTHAIEYDAIDPKLLLTLGQIMETLGHVGRKLDVLALDCEGCEWGALRQLACSGESTLVDQLFVEFHFQKNLGLATPADVIQAAEGINCLWHHRWHVVSIENSGSSYNEWEYTNGVTQVIQDGGFLLYLALQRIPDEQLRPADYLELAAQASAKVFQLEEKYTEQYKSDVEDKWSQEARDAVKALRHSEQNVYKSMERVTRASTVTFDKHPKLEES